jgi:hypothetical protein
LAAVAVYTAVVLTPRTAAESAAESAAAWITPAEASQNSQVAGVS